MLWRWAWGQHVEVSVLSSGKRQRPEGKLGAERELHIKIPKCNGLPGRILTASPLPNVSLSTSGRQIFGLGSGEIRRCKINLKDKHGDI